MMGAFSLGGRSEWQRRARAKRQNGKLRVGAGGEDAPWISAEACLHWSAYFSNQLSRATGMGDGITAS
jgi:hypothetical protein